jgi:hypothetical protein
VGVAAAAAKKSGSRSELEHASPIPSPGGPSGHASDESLLRFVMGDSESSFPPSSPDVA